jgi:ATP-dependent helicase/DNAse subunit B
VFKGKAGQQVLNKRIAAMYRGFFSVTAIDFYRKCPLRFYIENVLGLELETRPKFEVESRLWGSLAHRTMENLFKDGDKAPEVLDKELFRALEKALEHFPIGDFWSRVAGEIFLKLLPMLKEQESGIRMQGFSPCKVEEYIKVEINGLKLKGKIDRVDCKYEGRRATSDERRTIDDGQRKTVALLDYKTGAVDSKSLQLPLYAGMWQKEFPDDVDRLGYYSLKEGKVNWYPKRMKMDEFVSSALEQAEGLVSGIKKGIFPPEPAGDAECRYCSHNALCNK